MDNQRCEGAGFDWKSAHDADPDAADRLCAAHRAVWQQAEKADLRVAWDLFALQRGDHFEHFYPSRMQCQMCGDEPVVSVRLTLDEEGSYWGWRDSHHPVNRSDGGQISMVYRNPMLVEVCFPYGTAAEIKRGRGRVVRLRAETISEASSVKGVE